MQTRIPLERLARILGVNQTGLAAYLGVSRVTVSRWTNGHDKPRATTQALIDLSLHVEPDVLRFVAPREDRVEVLTLLYPGTARKLGLLALQPAPPLTREQAYQMMVRASQWREPDPAALMREKLRAQGLIPPGN